jgi:hypothetical protein
MDIDIPANDAVGIANTSSARTNILTERVTGIFFHAPYNRLP